MSPVVAGLVALLLTLAADQASKLYVLFVYDLPLHDPLLLGPFVTFTVVWNKGISYGLFQQESEWGRWALIVVAAVSTIALGIWMTRATNRLLGISLGLILGGAIGNAIDRIAYGAVFDFIHLHAVDWSWYVFNVADAAIVFGVAGLIWDAFVSKEPQATRDRAT